MSFLAIKLYNLDEMNLIIEKEQLSDQVYRMKLEAPLIAQERRAGQFIILQVEESLGERIPLTIMDADATKGTVDIIFQVAGATTLKLKDKEVGDSIAYLLGPLGQATHIHHHTNGPVVCVAGGIGAAPLHPIAQALKKAGNQVKIILGARNKDLIILEDRFRSFCDEVMVCTDDGSAGEKALVTEPLKRLCEAPDKPAEIFVIGPPPMMKFCALTTLPYSIPTVASLNTIMIDGTGMCGGCRVSINNKTKFACVDGPEFDAHAIDFDNLILRLSAYRQQEREHRCRVNPSS